jgi:urea transport system permease protein
MSSRPNFAALLLMIVQVLFIQHIFAESPRANQQSPEQTIIKANANDDAIQQFVRADFAQRRTMLNQWPASIEELDKLVSYVEKDELYTDSSGNTYIMKDGDKLFNYPQNQNITDC